METRVTLVRLGGKFPFEGELALPNGIRIVGFRAEHTLSNDPVGAGEDGPGRKL